jgi:hypothetical protein
MKFAVTQMLPTNFSVSALLCGVLICSSFLQAQSWPGGTLSSTHSTQFSSLGGCNTNTTSYVWTYTDTSGGAHQFSGTSQVIVKSGNCKGITNTGLTEWSTDSLFYIQATGSSGQITSVGGYVNPKYVILGVTYAPPGPQSFVDYSNSTLVGNETDISNSFSSAYTRTVSITSGAITGFGGGTVSGTSSTGYTQESDTSSSVTVTKTTTRSDHTLGPSDPYAPVNHDDDIIWLWLNPISRLAFTGNVNGVTGVQWLGYGYSTLDPTLDVDAYPVYVGWLNGDIPMPSGVQQTLARAWAAGESWPSGQGPGLTGPGTTAGTDLYNILQADPYGMCTPQPSTCPTPATVDPARFTGPLSGEDFIYQQPPPGAQPQTQIYTLNYATTSVQSQGLQHTFQQTFAIESVFKAGAFIGALTATITTQFQFTWKHETEHKITTGTTSNGQLSITGPPCNPSGLVCNPVYSTPSQFDVYEDNLYGTFVFIPAN